MLKLFCLDRVDPAGRANRELKQQRRLRLRKRQLKGEFTLLQTLSCIFHLVQFVKCYQFFLELNSKRLYRSFTNEKQISCLVFMFSTKREIRQFHVVVVQWRQRNVQKSGMHVQSCCFAKLNLLLFCRSCCRRRRHCLSSLLMSLSAEKLTRLGKSPYCRKRVTRLGGGSSVGD